MKKYGLNILFILPAIIISGCSSDPEFKIEGEIADAESMTLLLEKPDHGGIWNPIDSVRLGKKGNFSFSGYAPAAPEIYRLALNNQYIYFPVDSIENLQLYANAASFATNFEISGSDNAVALGNFEKELLAAAPTLSNPDSARNFKRHIYAAYLQEAHGNIVSYYILTKTIGNHPLFNPDDDSQYFSAVATSFRQFNPDDPRTEMLENIATEARRKRLANSGTQRVVTAEEISLLPIDLPNEEGKATSLASIAGNGKKTILVFSDYSDDATPALNIKLRQIYNRGNFNIYNVGIATTQGEWISGARNLPWTTVFANPADMVSLASLYQFSALPTIFLIDENGILKSRLQTVEELDSL